MAWEAIRAALAARYRVVRQEARVLLLAWEPREAGAPIAVRVELARERGHEWVVVLVDAGPASGAGLVALLRANLGLYVGSYALAGDRVVLRASDLLAATDAENVSAAIELLADTIAASRDGRATAEPVFAYLAE